MKKGKIKKVNKKIKLIILIAIVLIIAIISTIIIRNVIRQKEIENNKYLATGNENSSLIANYIKKGVTIGGITGTFEVLDTSDADATPEDIFKGKTAYVKGVKITGTRFSIGEAIDKGYVFEEDTTIKDDLENEVRIPGGFHLAEDSATKVEDGIVIEDDIGNQFVWIPAKTGTGITIHTTMGDKKIVYQRTDFEGQHGSYSDYSETLPADEETSVNANVGETEKSQTKGKGEAKIVPTGQTTAVSNIYDMGGNAWERTTENTILTSYPISRRGGDYTYNNSERAAGWRNDSNGNHGSSDSFRITLFCSTEA